MYLYNSLHTYDISFVESETFAVLLIANIQRCTILYRYIKDDVTYNDEK